MKQVAIFFMILLSHLFSFLSLSRVAALGSELVDLRLSNVSTLLSLLQLMLDLPQLGHVAIGCLLRLLSLSLVGLHLELQFIYQVLKSGNVLLILLSLVGQLLDFALVLADSLDSICTSPLCCLDFSLQLAHPALQFLELLLATLHGQVLSLIQTVLKVFDYPLKVSAGVLLLLQLLSHHGSVSDGLLGLLFSIP